MIKSYKCGTELVHDTALYASGGRLRRVVNMSTKKTARARMYNMKDAKTIGAHTNLTTDFHLAHGMSSIRSKSQGVKVIAMALMRHNTCSWYVGKAKNQAIQWMQPNMVAINDPAT
jgi:hypothetical protein